MLLWVAQADSSGVGLLKCYEGFDTVNPWTVYGEAVNNGPKAIHALL
jgi:hypothetical protein